MNIKISLDFQAICLILGQPLELGGMPWLL